MPRQISLALITHDDHHFLRSSLASFSICPAPFVFVSRLPWHGEPGDWERSVEIAKEAGAELLIGDWTSEVERRAAAFAELRSRGFTHALIPDSDEVIEPRLLETLLKIAEHDLADRVYVEWDTYWKDAGHVIRPREGFTPCIMVHLHRTRNTALRGFEGGRGLLLNSSYGILHHLSYAGGHARFLQLTTTYDAASQMTTSVDSSGTTTYTYDANGSLTEIWPPSGNRVTMGYRTG